MSSMHLLLGRFGKVLALVAWASALRAGSVAPAQESAPDNNPKDRLARGEAVKKMSDEVMAAVMQKVDSEMDPYVKLGADVDSADFQEVAKLTSAAVVEERLQKLKEYRTAVERVQKFLQEMKPSVEAMAAAHGATKEEAANFARGFMDGSPYWALLREYMALHSQIAELLGKRFTMLKEHFGEWKAAGDADVTFPDAAATKTWEEMRTKLKALEVRRSQLEDKILEAAKAK